MQNAEELRAHLRANGRKVTPQRELIASLLVDNSTHPTAEALFEAAVKIMPSLSLKTVYSVLADFDGLGEIRTVSVAGGPLRFDPNTSEHHHLICRQCGAIHDVTVDTSAITEGSGTAAGHLIDSVDVVLRGTCFACQTVTSSPSSATNHLLTR
jgi:Fur family transcriptional regulator, peroxide stress response regulator